MTETERATVNDEAALRAELPSHPEQWKIFPRNLTARAAAIVPGNPTTTRPEAGVDNCYPGLEMDARNIQKYFFPGLYFEVYRGNGARLSGLLPTAQHHLTETDLDQGLQIWAMKGRVAGDQDPGDPPVKQFVGAISDDASDGLSVWRAAMNLFRGRVGIVLGPGDHADPAVLDSAIEALHELFREGDATQRIERQGGRVVWAALVADRTDYLTVDGALDPDVYEPGELTRTLCTPWTYDFRDCQCFYWASNKPDIVSSEDGKYEYLNFQRKDRHIEPQTQDIAYSYTGRRLQEIDYAEMMTGWQQLRPVLNGREIGQTFVPGSAPDGTNMSLHEIVNEVQYLATVEHGLAVQYLYAYYSIDAVDSDVVPPGERDGRVWSAAQEIFQIAIDEMRHFLWANEILALLDAPTTVDRSSKLGRRFDVPFSLQSLSNEQLQWFIDVERPSTSVDDGLDGMYVGVLRSLQALGPDEVDPISAERAVELAKLIIDEGEGHFVRFSTAQQNLAFYDDRSRGSAPPYLRDGQWRSMTTRSDIPTAAIYGAPRTGGYADPAQQDKSDALYEALLGLLKLAFAFGPGDRKGTTLTAAVSQMFALNAVNLGLARTGGTPRFTLPPGFSQDPPPTTREEAMAIHARVADLLGGLTSDMRHASLALPAAHANSVDDVLQTFADQIEVSFD